MPGDPGKQKELGKKYFEEFKEYTQSLLEKKIKK